jgi:hypothetical protein
MIANPAAHVAVGDLSATIRTVLCQITHACSSGHGSNLLAFRFAGTVPRTATRTLCSCTGSRPSTAWCIYSGKMSPAIPSKCPPDYGPVCVAYVGRSRYLIMDRCDCSLSVSGAVGEAFVTSLVRKISSPAQLDSRDASDICRGLAAIGDTERLAA